MNRDFTLKPNALFGAMVALFSSSCSLMLDFEAGLACDDDNPCVEGYRCVSSVCYDEDASGPLELVIVDYKLLGTSDGDLLLEAGEYFYFDIQIKNEGLSPAREVEVGIVGVNDLAVGGTALNYWTSADRAIDPGESCWVWCDESSGHMTNRFLVSLSELESIAGDVIYLDVEITDRDDNQWELSNAVSFEVE